METYGNYQDRLMRMKAAMAAKRAFRAKLRELERGQFDINDTVRVVEDHDGASGRWVGAVGIIKSFAGWPFPWQIVVPSGAEIFLSSRMMTKTE